MGKFDRIFARPADPQPAEARPAFRLITPAMKALLVGEDEQVRMPTRRFVTLSHGETARHAEVRWPMWVEDRNGRSLVRRTLWSAPNEAAWVAANHNDPAPSDEELRAQGWQKQAGAPVQENGVSPVEPTPSKSQT